jgi:hypothetical protein
MRSLSDSRSRSKGKSVLWLTIHLFVGTWGISLASLYLTGYVFDFLRLFGRTYPRSVEYQLLSGTPYYPVQIILGLFFGWLLWRCFRHQEMLWVWIIPFAILCYAVVTFPAVTQNLTLPAFQAELASRLSHYFGWGCRPARGCTDETTFTLSFYMATSYSIGALSAQRIPHRHHPANLKQFWASLVAGWLFLLISGIVLIQVIESGWKWIYLPSVTVAAGTGAFLIVLAIRLWRKISVTEPRPRANHGITS